MANANVQAVATPADKVKLALAALVFLGGFVAFYFLSKEGPAAQWGAMVGATVLAAIIALLSERGRAFIAYARDSWRETQKVVWPKRKETTQMTLLVFAMSVVMAIFLWLVDKTLEWAIFDLIMNWGG